MSTLAPDLPPDRLDLEDPEQKRRRSAAPPPPAGPDTRLPSGAFAAGLILLHLACAAFVAWLLLVVAMNLFFSTKLLAKVVSSSPDSVVMDYRSVRSWWPGHAHVEGLHLRGSDDNLEWTLDVESADAKVALFDLPRKFFHATYVQASGAKFRIRRRLPAASFDGDPRYVAALPPISDRPFPPLAPDPPPLPIEGPTLGVWRIAIDDAEVTHLQQIWVEDHKVDGDGEVSGGFSLAPTQSLSVGPVHLVARGLDMTAGQVPLAEHMVGDVFATIGPVDLQTAPGAKLLDFLSAEVHCVASVPNLEAVNYYTRRTPLAVHGGAGTVKIDLVIGDGVLQPASEMTLESRGVTAALGGVDTSSDLLTRLRVEGDDAHVRADATHLSVRTDKGVPLAEAPSLAFDLDVGTRVLDRVALEPGMAVDVGDLSIPHVETWNALLGSDKLTIAHGELHGRLHGELEPVWTTGRGELSLHGPLAVVANGTHVAAGVAVDAKVVSFDLDEGQADLSGSRAEARDVRVDGQSDGPWWGRVELTKTHLSWQKGIRAETDVEAQSADARPVLLFLADQGTIPGWVHTVLTLGNARGHAHLAVGPGSFDMDNLVVTASELDTRAFLHVYPGSGSTPHAGDTPKTCVLITSGPFALGVDGRKKGVSLVLLNARDWFAAAAPCK
jgi:hypothetical protein